MTITFVNAGAVAVANNASVAPALPSGRADGDLLLLVASIRNSGTGVPNAPANWTPISVFGNVGVFGRWSSAAVSAPTVTFTGGVANADTQGVIVAFRGVSADALTASLVATLLNGSAQNIAYPALDLPGANHAVLLVAWKQDDSTAVSTPAGMTSAAYSSVTTGDGASLAVRYQVQTTEADIGASSLTVTGGVAAISRALVAALKPAAAIVATEQVAYPPRVQISVTGLTLGDQVEVYRVVVGVRTLIRGGFRDAVTDPSFVVVDAELPMGVPVSYLAIVEGTVEYTTSAATHTLPGGKVALSDAITGESAEVTILADGGKTRTRDSTRFRVADRNILVSGPLGQPEGSYDLFTETSSARDALMSLFANATGAIVQVRQPGVSAVTGEPYDGVDAYLGIDQVDEKRWSQDGSDPRRVVTIQYAEVDGWADELLAAGFTLQDIADVIDTGTLQDLANLFPSGTLLDIAQADWST